MTERDILSYTSTYFDLAEVKPDKLKLVLNCWRQACGTDRTPDQRDLNIREIKTILPYLALADVRSEPFAARYLIVGDALKQLLGRDPTGQPLDRVYPRWIYSEIAKAFRSVIEAGAPSFYTRSFVLLKQSYGYHRLLVPLRAGGPQISRMMIGLYPTSRKLTKAEQWMRALERHRQLEAGLDRAETAWRESVRDGDVHFVEG